MIPSVFDINYSQKDVIIIIHQFATLSINYLYTNDYDICIISNLNIFEKYLRRELSQSTHRKITVITVLSDIKVFIQTMIFLNSFDNDEGRLQNKNQFTEEYAYYLKEMQYGDDNSGYELNESELAFSPGQCDVPLPFELIVVLDTLELNDDHLSPRSVFLQQFFRFVSLKHGGIFVCTSNTTSLITDEKVILSFLLQIGHQGITKTQQIQLNRPEPIALYQSSRDSNNTNLYIRLLLPKGWDSWNKIQILATPAIYENGNSKYYILANEDEFHKLNLAYITYIDAINSHAEHDTAEHDSTEQCTVEQYKNDLYSLLFTDYDDSKKTHNIQKKEFISLEDALEKLQFES